MKVKVKNKTYGEVIMLKKREHKNPKKPMFLLRKLIYFLSKKEVKECGVEFIEKDMEKLGKKEPCLILMNHSCFLDLKIAFTYFKKRKFNIVSTSDGFVGKEWLMRRIGCIPTDKFVFDLTLVRDIHDCLKKGRSVLMYPEAGYSFDGTPIVLPESLGKLIKFLKVPVVTMITEGAYLHDPLYNNLQLRKTKVRVKATYLLSKEDIQKKSAEELNELMREVYSFDAFKQQQIGGVQIKELFRADGLHRVLYKCPHCLAENMTSTQSEIKCEQCGKAYTLAENGRLESEEGRFTHIPDWYAWQREEVRKEIEKGTYSLDIPVRIGMLADYKAIYFVGEGRLKHDKDGFELTGEGGLFYQQSPTATYSLNADYFWYEMGDIISIGDKEYLYYCFPLENSPVTKTRLAVEELYKIIKASNREKGLFYAKQTNEE